MTQVLCLALVHVASALLFASETRPSGPRVACFATRTRVLGARVAAGACAAWALVLWRAFEPGPAAFLVVLTAMIVSGSLIALLAPVAPRVVLALTAVCAASIPALVGLGGVP